MNLKLSYIFLSMVEYAAVVEFDADGKPLRHRLLDGFKGISSAIGTIYTIDVARQLKHELGLAEAGKDIRLVYTKEPNSESHAL